MATAAVAMLCAEHASAQFVSTWLERHPPDPGQTVGRLKEIGARVSGVLQESGGAEQGDLECQYNEVYGTWCSITVYDAAYSEKLTYHCAADYMTLATLDIGSQVEFLYRPDEDDPADDACQLTLRQRPEFMAESLSLDFPSTCSTGGSGGTGGTGGTGGSGGTGGTGGSGGNTGANFVCSGACLNAIPLSKTTTSAHLGGEAWYVVNNGPIAGWQLAMGAGRTVKVNGITVSPGQVPLVATLNGKYYFQFSSGDYVYASWSWW
jgi:hypothetical protein